jgi:hypothetical protein
MDLQPTRGVAMPPTVFIPRRSYDDDVLSLLEEELEEEVCGEEEDEEFKEALLRSIDCPWLSPPDHGYPNEDVLPRPEFVDIVDKAYFIPRSNYDDDFLFVLEEEAEEEVCHEEEEKEFKESLRRSMDRPLLSPPDHGYPDEDGFPRPEFVLIDDKAYFIERDNVTTASCDTRAPDLQGTIKVTFCTAPPPLVSYYCVHATAYAHTDFVTDPLIIASETDGGVVLLCLIIGKCRSDFFRPSCRHWFVYDSGSPRRPPSLKHLPHPGAVLEFNGPSFAIVRDCN